MKSDLFTSMLQAYASAGGPATNSEIYERAGNACGIPPQEWQHRVAIGKDGKQHSALKVRARWHQNSLRRLGLIERCPENGRGVWQLTSKGKDKLSPATPKTVLLGFSTNLGLALWASSSSVFPSLDEPIHLLLSSPPYPLSKPRRYGGPTEAEYTDWTCRQLEPILRLLVPGGSIALNLSNDVFEPGLPSRSLYKERLILALADRFGLRLMDNIPVQLNKPPGPMQWASRTRQQLNTGYEPVLWFTNDPKLCRSNNRRVLQPHTEEHLRLIARGGEHRTAAYGDGAYRLYDGSFANATACRIPKNVLQFGTSDRHKVQMRAAAAQQGLPAHGALMPLSLARFLVEFLTEPGDLVADHCAGWMTTGAAAEALGRRWVCTELMGEHVLGAANAFRNAPGFEMNLEWKLQ